MRARRARRFHRAHVDRRDLEQVAVIGLIKACDRYRAFGSSSFERYAWRMILGELMHHVRDTEAVVRVPRGLRKSPAVSLLVEPIDARAGIEERVAALLAVDALPERERVVVFGTYGLGMTQGEIATRLHISQRHVSRLLGRALERMGYSLM